MYIYVRLFLFFLLVLRVLCVIFLYISYLKCVIFNIFPFSLYLSLPDISSSKNLPAKCRISGLIPMGRSSGEGIVYWPNILGFLVTQLVKNLLKWGTWVRTLKLEDPENGIATTQYSCLEFGLSIVTKSRTITEQLSLSLYIWEDDRQLSLRDFSKHFYDFSGNW